MQILRRACHAQGLGKEVKIGGEQGITLIAGDIVIAELTGPEGFLLCPEGWGLAHGLVLPLLAW